MTVEITHEKIYERLLELEGKVDDIDKNTKDLVEGFKAVQGAFTVLGWIAKVAKPVLWVAAAFGATTLMWSNFKK
jgi:hypothetical protein